jgi:hypothetical protein
VFLQPRHERFQVAGAVPEVGLEVELRNDDVRHLPLQRRLRLALGTHQLGLEAEPFVQGREVWIAAEFDDAEQTRCGVGHG